MSTPIKSKLAYAWKRLRKKDAIYSLTLQPGTMPSLNNMTGSTWLEATPVKGKDNQFEITFNVYRKTHHSAIGCNFTTGELRQNFFGGPYTRDVALQNIQEWENAMLLGNFCVPTKKTHFKKRTETEIISNGVGGFYSINNGKLSIDKSYVDNGIVTLEKYASNPNAGPNGP